MRNLFSHFTSDRIAALRGGMAGRRDRRRSQPLRTGSYPGSGGQSIPPLARGASGVDSARQIRGRPRPLFPVVHDLGEGRWRQSWVHGGSDGEAGAVGLSESQAQLEERRRHEKEHVEPIPTDLRARKWRGDVFSPRANTGVLSRRRQGVLSRSST